MIQSHNVSYTKSLADLRCSALSFFGIGTVCPPVVRLLSRFQSAFCLKQCMLYIIYHIHIFLSRVLRIYQGFALLFSNPVIFLVYVAHIFINNSISYDDIYNPIHNNPLHSNPHMLYSICNISHTEYCSRIKTFTESEDHAP